MPIRIRPVLADPSGLPAGLPVRRAVPEDYGSGVGAIAYQAGRDLRDTGLSGMDQLLRINKELQQEDEKLDISTKMAQLKIDFAQREAEIRDAGVEPKDYAATVNQELRRLTQEAEGALKYPASLSRFRQHVAPYLAEQGVAAIRDGVKLQHQAILLTDSLNAKEETNAAVFGTPEERQAAFGARLSRIEDYTRRGILSGEQAAAKSQEFLHDVERGGVLRDYQNPMLRGVVIDNLLTGRHKHMGATEQIELAETLQNRSDAREKQAAAEREKAAKKEYDATVNDLYTRASPLSEKRLTPADLDAELKAKGLVLDRTDRAALEAQMTKEPEEAPSDPLIRSQVMADVLSMRPQISESRLRDLNTQHTGTTRSLNFKDYQTALGHRTSRMTALESKAESRDVRDYAEADRALRVGLGIPDIVSDRIDPKRLVALDWARQELNNRAWPQEGKSAENPQAVVKELLPRAQMLLGSSAKLDMDQVRELMPVELKQAPNPAAMALVLEEGRKAGRYAPGQYESFRRLVVDYKRAWNIHHQDILDKMQTPAAAPKPTGQPAAGGEGGQGDRFMPGKLK